MDFMTYLIIVFAIGAIFAGIGAVLAAISDKIEDTKFGQKFIDEFFGDPDEDI